MKNSKNPQNMVGIFIQKFAILKHFLWFGTTLI